MSPIEIGSVPSKITFARATVKHFVAACLPDVYVLIALRAQKDHGLGPFGKSHVYDSVQIVRQKSRL